MKRCNRCNGKLKRIPWNDKVNELFCTNTDCELYRRPIPEDKYPKEMEAKK